MSKILISFLVGFILGAIYYGNTPWNRNIICERLNNPTDCVELLK